MLIKKALVFDYKNNINGERMDILIEDERIRLIAPHIATYGEEELNAEGLYAIAGLCDIHAHLREPGQTHKETIATGTASAAKGGITTVVAMPNTTPAIDSITALSNIRNSIERNAIVEVIQAAAMTLGRLGRESVSFDELSQSGCSVYSDDGSAVEDLETLYEVCKRAVKNNALLIEHPEVGLLSRNVPFSYGKLEKIMGASGQAAESESLDILRLGSIAGLLGARVHFTHLSTQKAVEAVRYLKANYPNLFTCDCTPHHLLLNEDSVCVRDSFGKYRFDTNKKMNPPLRPESDRQAIERALLEGVIDCIATDHAPHAEEEKAVDFEKAPFGVVGFETLLSATYTFLVETGKLDMMDWVRLVSFKPSKIIGKKAGFLEKGALADITLFRPDARFRVTPDTLISKSKNSAFLDSEFHGVVEYTIARGKLVYAQED